MYRGTTPTLTFRIKDENIDFDKFEQIWITIKGRNNEITKDIDSVEIDAENRTLSIELTQEETLSFNTIDVQVQMRVLDTDGRAFASRIFNTRMNALLKGGVIE